MQRYECRGFADRVVPDGALSALDKATAGR